MSVGFGFSIGDFLAVGDLAWRIVQALDDSRGAPADYKSLCELLLSLHRSLHAASAVFFYPTLSNGGTPDPASLNGIRHELAWCKRLMDEFLVSSRKYTESLLNGRPGRRFKDEWKKITWSLYKADDIQKLQTKLQGHITAFQLYTFAINWQSLARTEQKAIENAETSNRIELRITDMFALLKSYHDNLPKAMGYPWEGECNQKPIHFEDALGRVVDLPLMLCRNKDSFHKVLEIMFADRPGHKRIAAKEYEVIDDTEGSLIEDTDWDLKVLPGARIAMGILITATARSGTESRNIVHKCPRCNTSNAGATIEKGSLRCCHCHLIFRTLDIERIVELSDSSPEENPLSVRSHAALPKTVTKGVNPTRSQKSRNEIKHPREEDVFRRIHYRLEVLKHSFTSNSILKRSQPPTNPERESRPVNIATRRRNLGWQEKPLQMEVKAQAAKLRFENIKKVLGEEHPDTIDAVAILANTYAAQGKWAEVEALEAQVLEIRRRTLGEDHLETVGAMASLANTYAAQGKWAEAEVLQVQVLGMRRRDLGEDHLETVDAMGSLARAYASQGRLTEAEVLEVQVLEMKRRTLGGDHLDTVDAMDSLAYTYATQGRLAEAEVLQVQALGMRRRALGEDHLETVDAMASLADTYSDQRKWADAEALGVQVLGMRRRALGEDHLETMSAMASLADTYATQGRWSEAEVLQVQVLEMRRRILGEDHLDTVDAMASLADTYLVQRKWTEAEVLQVQVLGMRRRVLGEDHLDTVDAMDSLARTYAVQGRWAEAEVLQVQVLEMRRRDLGEDHLDTVDAMDSLAYTYAAQGRLTEAEVLEAQVLEMKRRALGENHLETVDAMDSLADTYSVQGKLTEAEVLQVQALETRRRALGEDHLDTVDSMASLADTYSAQRKWADAEVLQVQVLEMRRRDLGEDHLDTVDAMDSLAYTYAAQGRSTEAEELRVQREEILNEEYPEALA